MSLILCLEDFLNSWSISLHFYVNKIVWCSTCSNLRFIKTIDFTVQYSPLDYSRLLGVHEMINDCLILAWESRLKNENISLGFAPKLDQVRSCWSKLPKLNRGLGSSGSKYNSQLLCYNLYFTNGEQDNILYAFIYCFRIKSSIWLIIIK